MNEKTPTPTHPPEAWAPLVRAARAAMRPLERFLAVQASSAVLLGVATLIAMLWANSPWSDSYRAILDARLGFSLGGTPIERSVQWIINDVLMVIFFFVVGMEIRRELHEGELSTPRRAALPVAAALGGMIAPALIYVAIAGAPGLRDGWGVPMATDIAFAVGVFAALGPRVPPALRVLLLAVAVIDDLGAILVIALFYTDGIAWSGILGAAIALASLFGLQALGVRARVAYVIPGVGVWIGLYAAGIHPTLAGVLVGLATPVRAWLGPEGLVDALGTQLDELAPLARAEGDKRPLVEALAAIDHARREALSPAEALIEALHPWVAFGVMPLFAFANAGVSLRGVSLGDGERLVALAIVVALLVGKPLGVAAFSAAAVRVGVARLPRGLTGRHLLVLGVVAGIGFTMSLFIAQLAFRSPTLLHAARLGVIGVSAVAVALGMVLGRALLPAERDPLAAASADEAERSDDT